jgi:hypothetical protein
LLAAVVGLATYAIVFNLKLIIIALRRLVHAPKAYLPCKMQQENAVEKNPDEDEWVKTTRISLRWEAMTPEFEGFPPREKNDKPSYWWLVIYALCLLGRQLIRWKGQTVKLVQNMRSKAKEKGKQAKKKATKAASNLWSSLIRWKRETVDFARKLWGKAKKKKIRVTNAINYQVM